MKRSDKMLIKVDLKNLISYKERACKLASSAIIYSFILRIWLDIIIFIFIIIFIIIMIIIIIILLSLSSSSSLL